MAEELVLLTRLSDLLCWLLPKSEKFPRAYRFTVTQRMMDAALDCQEAVFAAQSHRGEARKVSLRTADAALNRLRLYPEVPPPVVPESGGFVSAIRGAAELWASVV